MLVLSRKAQEGVIINDNIEIKIAQIDGDTVKLAIKAPKEVSIHRKEVYESVKKGNEAAFKDKGETKVPFALVEGLKKKQVR